MPQVIDPTLVAVINGRSYAALQTTRRNAANSAYEWGTAGWLDQSQTWAAQQVFLTGTSEQTPLVVRQTGGTAGTNEVKIWDDGTFGHVRGENLYLESSTGNINTNAPLFVNNNVIVAGGSYPNYTMEATSGAVITYTGAFSGTNYYLGTASAPGSITATDSAGGAGQTLTITGSSAGGLSTAAGGVVRVVPGAGVSGGAAGYFAVMQPGGTPGVNEGQMWHDGTNARIKNAVGAQSYAISIDSNNSVACSGVLTCESTLRTAGSAWAYGNMFFGSAADANLSRTGTGLITANGGLGMWGTTPPASQPAAITAPSGGAIQDAEARTAIAAILAVLSAASSGYGFTA